MPRIVHDREHADARGVPYWVYWNVPNRRVRIHFADCGHAKFGEGKHGGSTVDDGWSGPFDRIRDAWDKAHERARLRGLRDVAVCGSCLSIFDVE